MKQKALFLDRDGIINIDHGYVSQIENFEFTQDIFALLHLFIQKEYLLFIVTNQSGIGRDYYTLDDFTTLTQWMLKELKTKDISIEKVAYCPHAPEAHCACRKPQTGMIDNILETYTIDLENSWLIGDKQSDIDLAHNAHIGHSIAIQITPLLHSTYQFDSISSCTTYLTSNQESLL
jgi:D-glycero-D-manno-heptose 1,7-bisphosphate phosphatase